MSGRKTELTMPIGKRATLRVVRFMSKCDIIGELLASLGRRDDEGIPMRSFEEEQRREGRRGPAEPPGGLLDVPLGAT